jgi:hypothetical protein
MENTEDVDVLKLLGTPSSMQSSYINILTHVHLNSHGQKP